MTAGAERGLLVRAVSYALSAARLASPERLSLPTPCAGWNLRTLLLHIGDSMDALSEGLYTGFIRPHTAPDDDGTEAAGPADDGGTGSGGPVAGLGERSATLLCACAAAGTADSRVRIGDRELTTRLVTMTAAIEVAVHGWDISATCGGPGTVPAGLATDLLPIAALLAPPGSRAGLFADPVPVAELAVPGDRLVAFLGRRPCPLPPSSC